MPSVCTQVAIYITLCIITAFRLLSMYNYILMCFVCRLTGDLKKVVVVMIVTVRLIARHCGAPVLIPLTLALPNLF